MLRRKLLSEQSLYENVNIVSLPRPWRTGRQRFEADL